MLHGTFNPETYRLRGNRMDKSLEFPNEVTYPYDEILMLSHDTHIGIYLSR
jgi:hypothetical protein